MPLPLLAVGSMLWPLVGPEAPPAPARSAAESSYLALPSLPAGSTERTAAALESNAVKLTEFLHLVVLDAAGTPCPEPSLRVSWDVPLGDYHRGGYIEPLGPAPTAATESVNGIVICEGSTFSYAGFEARWKDGRWDLTAVPQTEADDQPDAVHVPEPAPIPQQPVPAVAGLQGHDFGVSIEGLAAYEPQRTCDPTPKPGTLALRNTLLAAYPGSRSLGIGTGCAGGDVSEHHEGRAFDWGVRITVPAEKAMAEDFIGKALAADQYGHAAALARRMGIMYMIWNHQIWGSYRADDGWRPYSGVSPHTDHVHISMSWAGGMGRTSFWTGTVAADIPTATLLAAAPRAASPKAASTPTTVRRKATTTTARPETTTTSLDIDQQQRLDELRARRRAQREATTTSTTLDPDAPTTTSTTSTTIRRTTTTTSTTVRPTTTTTVRPTTTTTVRPTTTTVRPTTTTTTATPATTTTTVKAATATTTTTAKPATTTTTTARPATTTTTTARPATTTTTTTTARPATTTTTSTSVRPATTTTTSAAAG